MALKDLAALAGLVLPVDKAADRLVAELVPQLLDQFVICDIESNASKLWNN